MLSRMQTHAETDDELIARYLEPNPYKLGKANYRLLESGMAMWVFAGRLEAANHDLAQIAWEYEISPAQIDAALAFYEQHRAAIDDHRGAAPPDPLRDADVLPYLRPDEYKSSKAFYHLAESGMEMWAFAGQLDVHDFDREAIARDLDLSLAQVNAATTFYERYREAIDDKRPSRHGDVRWR